MGMPTITGSMKAESLYVERTRGVSGAAVVRAGTGWHWKVGLEGMKGYSSSSRLYLRRISSKSAGEYDSPAPG